MTYIALAFVLIGSFLIVYSIFVYLQRDVGALQGQDSSDPPHQEGVFTMPEGVKPPPPSTSEPKEGSGTGDQVHAPQSSEVEGAVSFAKDRDTGAIASTEAPPADAPQEAESAESAAQSPENKERGALEQARELTPEQAEQNNGTTEGNILFQGRCLYYEDKSGQSRYDGSDIEIDESLLHYKNFYRIGEGNLSLTREGVSFENSQFLQHISFEEMRSLIFYQNCAVILPRKENVAKIFFPDKYSLLRTTFKKVFEQEDKI